MHASVKTIARAEKKMHVKTLTLFRTMKQGVITVVKFELQKPKQNIRKHRNANRTGRAFLGNESTSCSLHYTTQQMP